MKALPARHFMPLLIPLLLLLPGIAGFPYTSPAAAYSDAAISHYPNAVYLHRAVFEWHTVPLWSPAIMSGFPFAANPLSGLWYPPGWLAILLPLPFGFNLLILLHLLWAGVGMYLFLRSEGMDGAPSLLGALAFEAMPKLFAHYGAGHLTLVYAVTWTPWLLLASRHAIQRTSRLGWALPAVVFALVFLADVRWAAYAGVLWVAYVLLCTGDHSARGDGAMWSLLIRRIGLIFGWGLLAALLAAPLIFPLAEYTRLSTRLGLPAEQVLFSSLPPARLLGLLYPDAGGAPEWVFYPGWMVLTLALLAVVAHISRRRALFWALVAVLSLLFALGSYLPATESLTSLPLVDLLRVPPRALFLGGFALAVLAAYGMQSLSVGFSLNEKRWGSLLLFALVIFSTAFATLASSLGGGITRPFAWGSAAAISTGVWIGLYLHGRLPPRLWIYGVFALCLLDLLLLDAEVFEPRPAEIVLAEGDQAASFVESHPGSYRVYSPSYSLPQQTASVNDIRLADGVDPLQLSSYAAFMRSTSGVPASGYSVTLPSFAHGDPDTDNQSYLPNSGLLGLLNVRYVVAEYDLNSAGLKLAAQNGTTRIYINLEARPPAWVQSSSPAGPGTITPVEEIDWTPNRIMVRAGGPGLLVLSEIAYPGWVVRVDGDRRPMQTVEGILRAVEIDPGSHEVVFTFRPGTVYAGLACLVVGLSVILLGTFSRRDSRRDTRRAFSRERH